MHVLIFSDLPSYNTLSAIANYDGENLNWILANDRILNDYGSLSIALLLQGNGEHTNLHMEMWVKEVHGDINDIIRNNNLVVPVYLNQSVMEKADNYIDNYFGCYLQ